MSDALKKELRLAARSSAQDFFSHARKSCSRAMEQLLYTLPEYYSGGPLFCFVGTENEPDTIPLIRMALCQGRRVAVPLCTAPGLMEARLIGSLDDLTCSGPFGIPEPPRSAPLLPSNKIGFSVVPCLACDREGGRLGHGGGYYDRYLAHASFPWAVLCPEALLFFKIPMGPFDCRAPVIVSERQIYRPYSS